MLMDRIGRLAMKRRLLLQVATSNFYLRALQDWEVAVRIALEAWGE